MVEMLPGLAQLTPPSFQVFSPVGRPTPCVRLSMVIMDEIFGQLPPLDLPLPDGPDFSLDIDLNPKDMMELEEFDFDFEEINDLGSWIASSDDSLSNEEVMDSVNSENERLQHFEDLDIKEAVRYDCMWTSYNEFNAQKSARQSNNSSPTASLNLSSSFYDSLLGSIDTPENSDCSSIKSEMDTDSEDSVKKKKEEVEVEKEKPSTMSPAHIITSLDHCYNISSTHLDNERFLPRSSSGPLTPPVSSDDEDNSSSPSTNFAFSNINYKNQSSRNEKTLKQGGSRRIITTSSKNHSQSLLKNRPSVNGHRQRTLSEAKFSINLKVNRQIVKQTDKSRSLLKQKVKIVRTPFTQHTKTPNSTESQLKKKLFEQHRTSQSAMRKRKERSLKMQEGEAREVHNQMERQRRNELKVAFDDLKVHLPEIATSDKASKQQILDKAVETCLTIRSTESSLKTRVTSLNKTNSQLKEKLRKLQAEAKRRRDFPMGIADW